MSITAAQTAKFNRIIGAIAEAQDDQAMGYASLEMMRKNIASLKGELTAEELPLYETYRRSFR